MANYISREDLKIFKEEFNKSLNNLRGEERFNKRDIFLINVLQDTIDNYTSTNQLAIMETVNIIISYLYKESIRDIIPVLNFRKKTGERLLKTAGYDFFNGESIASDMVSLINLSQNKMYNQYDFDFRSSNLKDYISMMDNTRITEDADEINWIPCYEAMPEIPGTYLVAVRDRHSASDKWSLYTDIATSHGNYIDNFWDTYNDWYEGQEVHITHWAYMPINPMAYINLENKVTPMTEQNKKE